MREIKRRNSGKEEIIHESQAFVEGNKGLKINTENKVKQYPSPRISSEYMDCSMPMTFDSFSHCSLGCLYCFAYFFKSNNSSFNENLHVAPMEKMIPAIEGSPKSYREKTFYKHFYEKRFLLHWGGMADPFCHFERSNRVGYKLLEALGANNYPTLFSFKGATIFHPKYRRLFEKYSSQHNFAFQVSIVTGSDVLAKDVEIGVPSPSRRLAAIKMLSEMGYYTILRLRPFIIGVTDVGLEDLLGRALEAGIRGVSMEFFAVDVRCSDGMRTRYNWLSKMMGVKDLLKYFKELSPSERGGYMRLNRRVKEIYVRTVFEFCMKHNLTFGVSDPDFKELNTSGSCCGMPDNFPENRLLENWTKGQLTYALKEARRKHHLTGGESQILRFNEVYKTEDTYLDEVEFTNDHVACAELTAAERRRYTYRSLAQRTWNNLRSPGNPRNYFHGKLLPVGLGDDGNLEFRYVEHNYERRWKDEGLDLTR